MTILLWGILLVLYGVMSQRKYSVWVGMFFVLVIMGFQEGVPGDYFAYKEGFEFGGFVGGVQGSSIKENEYSFIWLTQNASQIMSFHLYVLLTSIVQCYIITLMIKRHVDRKYQYFAVLLVFFTFNIMMVQMKAMRQGYAVEMLLLAYYLLYKRKFVFSLLSILVGFGFHNSSMIAIPFYLFLFFTIYWNSNKLLKNQETWSNKAIIVAFIVTISLLCFYFLNYFVISSYISPFLMGLDFFEYGTFLEDMDKKSEASWMILLYYAVSTFVVSLYAMKEKDIFYRFLSFCVITGFFLAISLSSYGNLQRIIMYFQIFSIVIYPRVACMLRHEYGKLTYTGYILFNMIFLMRTSVVSMLSTDYDNGNGFASYTFSFLNW